MPALGHLHGELLVFDKDGVLLDFGHRWVTVTRARARELAARAPGILSVASAEQLLGLEPDGGVAAGGLLASGSRLESTTAMAVLLLQAGWAWPLARELATEAFDSVDRHLDFAATSRMLPGVHSAIATLYGLGWKCAMATTDQTPDALRFLQLTGLDAFFCSVVGVDRVRAGKPAPEMFTLACREAGCEPARAIMVGDLDVDLEMGRRAGSAGTIGVLSGVGDAKLLKPLADFLLPDLGALAALASRATDRHDFRSAVERPPS
jgi:phosphoglycolate phosphatase